MPAQQRPADSKSAIRQSATLRYAVGLLVLLCCPLAGSVFAQPAATNTAAVQFRVVDIFVDSKDKPLAAYQLEFTATNGNAKIVGIEGGEHPAFAQPPFYDPVAMQNERVILAAFSTEAADNLPKGKTRVATIHVQASPVSELVFETTLHTAASADGKRIEVSASSEERKPQ